VTTLSPAPWLAHFERHVPVALDGVDPEGVHQVRVAGRRLRVLLELGGHAALVGDVRWLVRALGRVRDLDVLRDAFAGAPAADGDGAAWMAQLEADARREAHDALTSPRLEGLLRALRVLRPLDEAVARQALQRMERRTRARLGQLEKAAASSDGDGEAVHALRRALRQLRYARDWLGDESEPLKHLQEVLGAICDLSALRRLLAEWSAAEDVDVRRALARLDEAHRRLVRQLLDAPAALAALR
jgi:CHAD domain-containing protein